MYRRINEWYADRRASRSSGRCRKGDSKLIVVFLKLDYALPLQARLVPKSFPKFQPLASVIGYRYVDKISGSRGEASETTTSA